MARLPTAVRSSVPASVRDHTSLRAAALALGLIPPRTMHSEADAQVLLGAASGARVAVEIGVYEGASALLLARALGPAAELHLIDPFGRRPDALPSGWAASERSTRRVLGRELRRLGERAPRLAWHPDLSADVAARWSVDVDLVFIDGDHSEQGCERDWLAWSPFVAVGGHVVFHDARMGAHDGRGLPGPTAVVERYLRAPGIAWEIASEADATVAARRLA
jgi:predicted O-methyltransferase YrrM